MDIKEIPSLRDSHQESVPRSRSRLLNNLCVDEPGVGQGDLVFDTLTPEH